MCRHADAFCYVYNAVYLSLCGYLFICLCWKVCRCFIIGMRMIYIRMVRIINLTHADTMLSYVQMGKHPHRLLGGHMQFREQGRSIQCIRTVYDKEIGRGRQTVIAKLPRYATQLPTTGLEELTEAERGQLEAFIEERRVASQQNHERYTVMSADRWLVTLAKAVREGQDVTPAQAAAIWQAMGDVGKALRKAGHPKPKAARKGEGGEAETVVQHGV